MAEAVRGRGQGGLTEPDTIFAIATGAPPAAIAIMRVSGPRADDAILALAGTLPSPRQASLRRLRDADGAVIDDAVVLRFAGSASATGEPVAEFHIHGGRAVAEALASALVALPGFREAIPGEFTRRSFANGRIDLVQAEGLADLLAAETQAERRNALAMAEGHVSRRIVAWADRATRLSAQVEALIDFADEDEVDATDLSTVREGAAALAAELAEAVANPTVERTRNGPLVILAGPPNSGKSSLFNAVVGRDAAIVTSQAGTTRDAIEASVMHRGRPYRLIDTAGVREDASDEVERIGIARALELFNAADVIVWLGDCDPPTSSRATIRVQPRSDLAGREVALTEGVLPLSSHTGAGLGSLWAKVEEATAELLNIDNEVQFNRRQAAGLRAAQASLRGIAHQTDLILLAEQLRSTAMALRGILGEQGIEATLDAIFGQFCLGK